MQVSEVGPNGIPTILPYMTGRGVCFAPHLTHVHRCLKCAELTTRKSTRTFGSLAKRSAFGPTYLQTMRAPITICSSCESMWTFAVVMFVLSLALPFALPILVIFTIESGGLAAASFPGGGLLIIATALWARSKSLRVKSLDEDGMLEVAGAHPEVAAEIVGDDDPDP